MLKYGVYSKGGPIGKSEPRLIGYFSNKDEAKLKAKGLNLSLSPGEKKYYGMGYVVRMVSLSC